jgi:anti-sigma-K factor RskA
MKTRDRGGIVSKLFDGLAPAAPPPQLRFRVLTAARAEAASVRVPDVWTRIWENRWLRLVWVASVVALVLGHVALLPSPPPAPLVTAALSAEAGISEFSETMRIEASATPNLGRAADATRGLFEPDDGGQEYE